MQSTCATPRPPLPLLCTQITDYKEAFGLFDKDGDGLSPCLLRHALCAHVWLSLFLCARSRSRTCALSLYAFVSMNLYARVSVFLCASLSACVYACVCVCMRVCTCVCVCGVCMSVRERGVCARAFIYRGPPDTNAHACVCMHARTHAHTHTHLSQMHQAPSPW